jgi:ABC-type Zn uptake system ZnuABC Zn-binding protein ZnuA
MKRVLIFILPLIMSMTSVAAQNSPLKVVATTTIVADVAQNVGGNLVTVTSLVPVDADAHAFEPSPQDALAVSEADAVLAVGAGYEAFLAGLEENADRSDITIVSNGVTIYPFAEEHDDHEEESHAVEPLGVLGTDDICDAHHEEDPEATEEADHDEHEHGACDPHVWTDPQNVVIWADNIAEAFAAKDPANADIYRANADTYKEALVAAGEAVRQILSAVPDEKRVLVTNHEFMSYFARAYDFEVVGVVIPGGSTGGEIDPQAMAGLIATIQAEGIPAIFAEASANAATIEAVAGDAGVSVVTTLSESLTAAGGVAETYLAYLTYNAQAIADALVGSQ